MYFSAKKIKNLVISTSDGINNDVTLITDGSFPKGNIEGIFYFEASDNLDFKTKVRIDVINHRVNGEIVLGNTVSKASPEFEVTLYQDTYNKYVRGVLDIGNESYYTETITINTRKTCTISTVPVKTKNKPSAISFFSNKLINKGTGEIPLELMVMVTNNPHDENIIWEDATEEFINDGTYMFTNNAIITPNRVGIKIIVSKTDMSSEFILYKLQYVVI